MRTWTVLKPCTGFAMEAGQKIAGRSQVLEHLGPYASHAPVGAFGAISDKAFALYREAAGGHVRDGETPTQHLITRMMYVAEATSIATRLNASWALSHPALSLLRDRYEQVVRFSWLARQAGTMEMTRYVASYYAKGMQLHRSMSQAEKDEYVSIRGEVDEWMTTELTKQQRTSLNRWNDLDLHSMVKKRDELPPLSDCDVAKETLASLYTSIYAQFSSVTHYDMYSMNMLGLYKSPDGQMVLAPDPHWPSMINLHNSLFDLIQCFEVTRRYLEKDADSQFSSLLKDWREFMTRVVGPLQARPA
jgi:hypothetical protein